jgi:hypothetical protein
VIRGSVVTLALAVQHPSLEEPVAHLGEIPIAEWLEELTDGDSVGGVLLRWSLQVSPSRASAALAWLWSHGIVETIGETLQEFVSLPDPVPG